MANNGLRKYQLYYEYGVRMSASFVADAGLSWACIMVTVPKSDWRRDAYANIVRGLADGLIQRKFREALGMEEGEDE